MDEHRDIRRAVGFDQRFEPLAALLRGDVEESLHRGGLAVVDAEGRLRGNTGDPAALVHLRSAAKPFQALAVVESGAADAFGVTSEELAVMAGSHAGQTEHVRAVRSLLARSGAAESELVCGPPIHMCSGKHAGMLLLAHHLGAPRQGYELATHPVQQTIARTIAGLLAGRPAAVRPAVDVEVRSGAEASAAAGPVARPSHTPESLFVGIDGCGVPVVRLSLDDAAWLFALLAQGATPALVQVRDAMLAHPEMVAGKSRLDTRVMRAAPGRVAAKGGAEGVQGLALLAGDDAPALGCVIKVEDGSARSLPALTQRFLEVWGLRVPAGSIEQTSPRDEWTARALAPGELRLLVDARDFGRPAPAGGVAAPTQAPAEAAPAAALEGAKLELVVGHGDEKELIRFLREEWPLSDQEVFGRQTQWIADPYALILKQKRRVVGVLKGHFLGGLASIDEFIVGHEYRGSGLGAVLLARFEEEARRRGCGRVVLRAVRGGRAEYFYRRHGYETECVQLNYEFGEDFIRLTHRLQTSDSEG